MPETAEAEARPNVQFAVYDKARTEAFDNEDKQERADVCLIERAIPELGKCRGVCIVFDIDRQVEACSIKICRSGTFFHSRLGEVSTTPVSRLIKPGILTPTAPNLARG